MDEIKPFAAGFEFEIMPEVLKPFKSGDKMRIQLIFRGKSVNGVVKVGTKDGIDEVAVDGFCEITLKEGVNVIVARYVDEISMGVYDKRNLTATLTVVAR